jgi:hypothetical protein
MVQISSAAQRAGWLALIMLPLALTGCDSVISETPAITEATRAGDLPLQPGRYCGVDTDNWSVDTQPGKCAQLTLGKGVLTITSEDPSADPKAIVFEVADLTRGASLVQARDADSNNYDLYIAVLGTDGAAIPDVGDQTAEVEALAREAGVTLEPRPEPAKPKPGEDSLLPQTKTIHVLTGKPDAVLLFMRKLTDSIYAAALKDNPAGQTLKSKAVYALRVGASDKDPAPDEATIKAKVAVLEGMLDKGIKAK